MQKNLLNQRFYRLSVICQLESVNGRAMWKCLCDCGNEKVVSSTHLLSGSVKSCGCYRSDIISALRESEAIPFSDRLLLMPSGCIEWQGARDRGGYGTLRSGKRDHKAHRFAYEKAFGPIPSGMLVCHTCDNPPCCNPEHLFLGTPKENSADCVIKGRQTRGERQGNAKITDHIVCMIMDMYRGGKSQQAIADNFGVHQTTISKIVRGIAWKHVK